MKRRVLRAHANKRNLRLLSAEHGLRLDAYNVLCDASFLRAVALAENNSARSLAKALKGLVYDTFAAATSHAVQESSDTSSGEARRFKDLSLSLFYLPETATALRRLAQRQEEQGMPSSSVKGKRGGAGKCEGKFTSKDGKNEKGSLSGVLESLLSGLECIGRENVAVHKNEAKAIAQFVAAAASGQGLPPTIQERRNARCFFVATQSHDVRRLLPGNTALIRLTTSPTALWIEKNADAFHYNEGGIKQTPTHSASAPLQGVKGLSAMDVAFIRHLSEDLLPGASATKRRRLVSPNDGARTSAAVSATPTGDKTTTGADHDDGVEKQKNIRRRKGGAHRPNPLAMKKKRVREVFRVDSGAPRRGS